MNGIPYSDQRSVPTLQFREIGVNQGLSQSHARAVYHDPNGFVWVGTQDGLNRYDGYEFRIYRNAPADPYGLVDKEIYSLTGDGEGRIWVGTANGLDRYNPKVSGFEHFNLGNGSDRKSRTIRSLYRASGSELWVGTDGGLFLLDPLTQKSRRYDFAIEEINRTTSVLAIFKAEDGSILLGTTNGLYRAATSDSPFYNVTLPVQNSGPLTVNDICDDGDSGLWIASFQGLFRIVGETVSVFRPDSSSSSLPDLKLHTLHLDHENNLWIGTDRSGLVKWDKSRNNFQTYNGANGLPGKGVWSISPDPRGGLWLGTFEAGLCRAETSSLAWEVARSLPDQAGSLSDNHVLSMLQTTEGSLWVGTDAGLNRRDSGSASFKHYRHDPRISNSLPADAVTCLLEDRAMSLWLGTWGGGLARYRPETDDFLKISSQPGPQGLSSATVISLLAETDGSLWVGTINGLNQLDSQARLVKKIEHDASTNQGLSHPSIFSMLIDRKGSLWVGTRNGLNRHLGGGRFQQFSAAKDGSGPSHGTIVALVQDIRNADHIWVATPEGLNRLDLRSETFQYFGSEQGLPNGTINGIVEDSQERLWLSSNQGLVVTDKTFENIRVFDTRDGLPTQELVSGAFFRHKDGVISFGSVGGLIQFNPDSFQPSPLPSKVLLTAFLVDNREVDPVSRDHQSPLPSDIQTASTVTLNHQHRMFSIDFAANEFSAPWHSRFRYRLVGFDRRWFDAAPGFRRATYTNLPPGSYTFEVDNAVPGKSWNNTPVGVDVIVLPAPWLTWWAKLLYGCTLLFLVGWYLRLQRQKLYHEREASRQQRLLTEKERETAERLRELDKLKDQFLANTSHELRTPLNGIIGLVDGILSELDQELLPNTKADLKLIAASGRRLTCLVNDILDFSLLRRGELTLYLVPVNLHSLVEMVVALSRTLIQGKDLILSNEVDEELPAVLADENRLGQILLNLVGNAIKFTPKGKVNLYTERSGDSVTLFVKDTGIGIAAESQHQIFESFRQADGGIGRAYGGTGLGLAITRRLVELHGSKIVVDSTIGQGSCFYFSLILSDEPKPVASTANNLAKLQQDEPLHSPKIADLGKDPGSRPLSDFHIYVVDDEPVNRRVLINFLRPRGCRITEASNGEECLDRLKIERPDLILLDVMMPGLSGYQVCARLRETFRIEDLPVIFLTARNRIEDMTAAFGSGANDFIPKPVAREELMARVNTHLQLLESTRDLDERVKERTQALVISQKMAGIGTLALGLAHEINNPNNFIGGGSQIAIGLLEELREEYHEDPAYQPLFNDIFEQLKLIRSGSKRISQVVSYLNLFSKRSSKGKVRVELTQILDAALQLLQAQNQHIHFECEWHNEVNFTCMPDELSQAFLSILTNACEAINLRLNGPDVTSGLIRVTSYEELGLICFNFTDNGVGIKPELLSHVFDAFFTTKRGNTPAGLGLYIAWDVVNRHDGHIRIASELDKGTQVILSFRNQP